MENKPHQAKPEGHLCGKECSYQEGCPKFIPPDVCPYCTDKDGKTTGSCTPLHNTRKVSPEKNISNCSDCGMSWNKHCGKVVSPAKEEKECDDDCGVLGDHIHLAPKKEEKDCCTSLKQKIKEEIEKMKKKPLIYLSVKGKTVVRPAHGKPMNKINGYNQALTDLLSLIDTL